MTTTPTEERVARLEGAYEHLATKRDVANLEIVIANLETEIANLKSYIAERENRLIRWMVSLVLGGMAGISALTIIISKFIA